jgi:hypothetical protein
MESQDDSASRDESSHLQMIADQIAQARRQSKELQIMIAESSVAAEDDTDVSAEKRAAYRESLQAEAARCALMISYLDEAHAKILNAAKAHRDAAEGHSEEA